MTDEVGTAALTETLSEGTETAEAVGLTTNEVLGAASVVTAADVFGVPLVTADEVETTEFAEDSA